MANDSTTVATVTTSGQIDRMEEYRAYMLRRAQSEGTDTKEIARRISARNADSILNAETEQEIWDAGTGGAVQGRDAVGLELEIHSFRPVVSTRTFDGEDEATRKGYYISAPATVIGGDPATLRKLALNIGDEIEFQTGADDVEYRLRAFELRGILDPEKGKSIRALVGGVETSSGNTLLKLRQVPVRAVPATVAS